MIRSVKLKHFRSHEVTEVAFGKGTNLLIGPMGAGKSSILDAICFAFFGTFPAVKARRIKLEDVITNRPNKYEEASVEVWFDANEKQYSIERVIAKNGTEARLRLEGKVIESAPQRATEFVEKLLGVDYELFTRAVYSEQNRLDALLSLSKSDRKKQVDQLLGIDAFETARTTATSVINRLKAAKTAEATIAENLDVDGIKTKLDELTRELATEEKRAVEYRREANDLAIKTGALEQSLEAQETALAQYNQLENEKSAEQARLDAIKASHAETSKKLSRQWTKQEAIYARQGLDAKLNKARQQRIEAAQRKTAVDRLNGELAAITAELTALEGTPALDAATAALAEQKNKLALAREARQAAAARKQALAFETKAANEAAARIDALKQACQTIQARLQELEKKAAGKDAAEKALAEARTALADAYAKRTNAEEALAALAKADAACPVCDAPLEAGHREALKKSRAETVETCTKHADEHAGAIRKLEEESHAATKAATEAAAEAERLVLHEKEITELTKKASKQAELTAQLDKASADESKFDSEAKQLEARVAEASATYDKANQLAAQLTRKATAAATLAAEEKALAATGFVDDATIEDLAAKLEEASAAVESFTLLERIEEAKRKRNALEIRQKELGFNETELKRLREEKTEAAALLARTEEKMQSIEARAKERREQVAALKQQLEKASGHAGKAGALTGKIEGVSRYSTALTETQAALRQELVDAINSAMAELWPGIYPYKDFVSSRLSATEDDYSLEIESADGTWENVDNVSGGERSCAALTLRTALAVVLTPTLSWLVLDEPTHNMDSRAVGLLCRALREDLPRVVDQVFVITHDDLLKEAGSAKVYKIERNKDGGDRTSVEALTLAN